MRQGSGPAEQGSGGERALAYAGMGAGSGAAADLQRWSVRRTAAGPTGAGRWRILRPVLSVACCDSVQNVDHGAACPPALWRAGGLLRSYRESMSGSACATALLRPKRPTAADPQRWSVRRTAALIHSVCLCAGRLPGRQGRPLAYTAACSFRGLLR